MTGKTGVRSGFRLKINIVLPHQLPFPPTRGGGVENLNWLLAKEFVKRNNEVTAYSRTGVGLADREVDANGIRHVRVIGYDRHPNRFLDHLNGIRYAKNLSCAIEAADITSFHTPFSFLLRYKSRIGIAAHTIHRTPKWPLPLYRGLDRVYCGSDAVVMQARAIDGSIMNLKRVYNCIESSFEPQNTSGTRGAGLVFLYVGRFVADKGIESLVKGFESSLRDFPKNRLRTVGPQQSKDGGDTKFFEALSDYRRRRGLAETIEFLPAVYKKERLNALIAEADVVCVPSLNGETFSMAVLEAMALAKPVLVSDFSPMPEAVDHQKTGYVARVGDFESIAEGIRYFSTNSHVLSEMGKAALEKVRRCFSAEKIAAEYLEDFRTLVAARSLPSKASY